MRSSRKLVGKNMKLKFRPMEKSDRSKPKTSRINLIHLRLVRMAIWGIALASGFHCRADDEETVPAVAPDQMQVEVQTAPLRQGKLPLVWKTLGTITLPPTATSQVMARAPGVLQSIKVREGERITSGALLMMFDARAAQTQLAKAQAALRAAQRDLNKGLYGGLETDQGDLQLAADQAETAARQARKDAERLKTLHDQELTSDKQLEEALQNALTTSEAAKQAHLKMERFEMAGRKVEVSKLQATVSQAKADL